MSRFRQLLPWCIVLLLLGWASYGVWPIVPVEGDEQGVLFGITGLLKNDALLQQMNYTYYLQPGYYQLLAGLVRLGGGTPDFWFGLTTALGALGFALAGARLLQILLDWPLGWTLAAMLWCQEVTAAACYMNTSALAGGVALTAVLLAGRPQRIAWVGAGLLLALAGWLRLDCLLVAPACLGLAYWREKQWRTAICQTALIAGISLVAVLGLYALSGARLSDAFGVYGQRGFLHTDWLIFAEVFPLLLSPALALAALAGLGLLLLPRWRTAGLVFVCGVAVSLPVHGTELTTPKYFYAIVPFLLLPALVLVDELVRKAASWPGRRRRVACAAAMTLVLADGLLGLRTLAELQRIFRPSPTLVTFIHAPWKGRTMALVLGPGELILNVDAFRLRTGKWFAPACWHREKQRMQADLTMIQTWLANPHDLTLFWSSWLTSQVAARELLAAGFRLAVPAGRENGAAAREECCIGDTLTMTPPVTGNGMSMAFESAELAVEPLAAYSHGRLEWLAARRQVAQHCDAAFRRRLAWARALQWMMLSPLLPGHFGPALLRSEWLWRLMFTRTR